MADIKLNGKVFQYDPLDIEQVAAFEDGLEVLESKVQKAQSSQAKKISPVLREVVTSIFEFLNGLFGEGTDKAIFGDRVKLDEALDVVGSLTAQVVKAQQEGVNDVLAKYQPKRKGSPPTLDK